MVEVKVKTLGHYDSSFELPFYATEGAAGADVRAPLLKVGHHGSRFSSSPAFLAAVKPIWAVISVGTGNTYHHPHPSSLLHLQRTGVKILRTDQEGDIRLETDGHGGWRLGT